MAKEKSRDKSESNQVQADAMATYKNAVEAGNTESPECKTAHMILDFIDGYKTINRFKSVPKKVYHRLLVAENEYYAMADDTTLYSNVIAPIMKMTELSFPKFMDKVVS